jgi:hypothetical protein
MVLLRRYYGATMDATMVILVLYYGCYCGDTRVRTV